MMKPKTTAGAKRRVSRADALFQSRPRDSMREWLEERLAKLPDLEIRRMFGGAGIYAEGTMFGILHANIVYFKTSDATRAMFIDRGMTPFRPPSGAVLKSYYEVPAETLDDDADLLQWARAALTVAQAGASTAKARRVEPEEILKGYAAPIRKLAERLRKVVLAQAPGASEAGYPGWRLVGYRCPHYFCFVAPHADHVRLGFEHATGFPTPPAFSNRWENRCDS